LFNSSLVHWLKFVNQTDMSYYNLEDLEVYQLAETFSDDIWFIVHEWDYFAKDTVGKQMVRSADSISANIAEGYGRFHYKENRNFCYFSRGSIIETKGWLKKSKTGTYYLTSGLMSYSKSSKLFTSN
jgi:four helix bundle protein